MPEDEELKERVEQLEHELHERIARANAAVAAAQDRVYWLDRWHLDLDAVMRTRTARTAFEAARWAKGFLDGGRVIGRDLRQVAGRVRARSPLADARAPDLERVAAQATPVASPVTDRLYERLRDEDLEAITSRLTASDAALWAAASDVDRRRLALAFACHYGLQEAVERTGLTSAMPPADVYAIGRGSVAAGGSYYYADLVASALASVGLDLDESLRLLDFGCSSGRVTRVLAPASSEVDWHGCDPNRGAIEWAAEHLDGVRFEVSPMHPPLPYGEATFDAAFAISIWSHLSPRAATAWLDELRRLVKPSGLLVLTTHGESSIAHAHERVLRSPSQLREIRDRLYRCGYWYALEFGPEGDHGVKSVDWGTTFLSPAWLLDRATPAWELALLRQGVVEENQDLYVLRRR